MTAQIIDGKTISRKIQAEIGDAASKFFDETGVKPKLAAVLVGEDPASQVYVRNKERACARSSIDSELFRLPDSSTTKEVVDLVQKLNDDPAVHGILVQLPLPDQVDAIQVLDTVDPRKDVDAFHPENVDCCLRAVRGFCLARRLGLCICWLSRKSKLPARTCALSVAVISSASRWR